MKDPLDNGRTLEIPFEPVPEAEPEFKTSLTPEQIAAAAKELRMRSFSGRNPELGKMINCPVHGWRHRQFEFGAKPCEQTFTYKAGDYEYFREEENGELVPAYRTAVDPQVKPTRNQILGQPIRRNFSKPRYNPHPSKWKLLLVERTRAVFADMGFTEVEGEQAQKNMHLARTEAACQLIREAHRAKRRARKARKTRQGA